MIKEPLSPAELTRTLSLKSTRSLFESYMVGTVLKVFLAKNGAIIGMAQTENNPTPKIRQIDNSLNFLDAVNLSDYCYQAIMK